MKLEILIGIIQMLAQKEADAIKKFSFFIFIVCTIFNSYSQKIANNPITNEPEFRWKAFQEVGSSFPTINEDSIFYFKAKPSSNYHLHPYDELKKFLVKDVPLFKNDYGYSLFIFRVNGKGKIDFLKYFGNTKRRVVKKIKLNIFKTENNWVLPKEMDDIPFRYFIFSYRSFNQKNKSSQRLNNFNEELKILYFIQTQIRKAINPKDSIVLWLGTLSDFQEILERDKDNPLQVPF